LEQRNRLLMPTRDSNPHPPPSPALPAATVCVTIVTYNSRRFIAECLEAVLRQEGVALEVVVVDNASTDGTRDLLAGFADRVRVVLNARNLGFAAAQNQAIAASSGEWILALNPDALLLPGFIARLVEAGGVDERVGTVCGRLLTIGPDFQPCPERRIDSTGIYFTPAMRHFDRGSREPDDGRFARMEYVFGASAAAALYRRRMVADISEDGEFFDPDFFVYREDADVAWRAQWLGWRCVYTPDAVAYHVRTVVAGNRRAVPALVNMHSVKNRFLMRIKNTSGGLFRRYWLPMMARDLVVVGGCLLSEPRSLAAFWHLAKGFRSAWRRRRWIMSRRRATDESLAQWFASRPAAQPVACPPLRPRPAETFR
jgi:GT2 family glycosyltransferase